MRKIRGIVESTTAPEVTEVIWLNNGQAKYFSNGQWIEIGKENNQVDIPIIYFGNTKEILEHNLEVASNIRSNEYKTVHIKGYEQVGSMYYDTLAVYKNGACAIGYNSIMLDLNRDTGELTLV